jgi:hypothetical protein
MQVAEKIIFRYSVFVFLCTMLNVGCSKKIVYREKSNKSAIQQLYVIFDDVNIVMENSDVKKPDLQTQKQILNLLKKETSQTLSDKYQLVISEDTTNNRLLVGELLMNMHKLVLEKSSNQYDIQRAYQTQINTSAKYVLVIMLNGKYDPRYSSNDALSNNIMMNQLYGSSFLFIPINRNKNVGYTYSVLLLDNERKNISYYYKINAKNDPRNGQSIEKNVYKSLKPIYYW